MSDFCHEMGHANSLLFLLILQVDFYFIKFVPLAKSEIESMTTCNLAFLHCFTSFLDLNTGTSSTSCSVILRSSTHSGQKGAEYDQPRNTVKRGSTM